MRSDMNVDVYIVAEFEPAAGGAESRLSVVCAEIRFANGSIRRMLMPRADARHADGVFLFNVDRIDLDYRLVTEGGFVGLRKIELDDRDLVCVELRHVLESLGEEAACGVAAWILNNSSESDGYVAPSTHGDWVRAWACVFGLLDVRRQVSAAVADSRLVRHLSPEARALYVSEHPELAEAVSLL